MWHLGRQMASSLFGEGGGAPGGNRAFRREYACYPVSFVGKDELEKGNKILLPQSALHQLARMNITWPMLFEVRNPSASRMTHSGVLEFVAEEGICYMPYWIMQNLLLKEGEPVEVSNATLPKGQYVKLQPVTKDFLDVSNPRAVLENAFRNYATLTVGDNVVIQYCDKTYEIEVVELKPANAVSIIETDIQVDFKAPKDFVEPPPKDKDPSSSTPASTSATTAARNGSPTHSESPTKTTLFQGVGHTLCGRPPPPRRKVSNVSERADDEEPWKRCLLGGVRTFDPDYERLVAEGKIPGIIGKVKAGGLLRQP